MSNVSLSDEQIRQFDRDGYLFVEGLFDREEVELLEKVTERDRQIANDAYFDKDSKGGQSRIWLTTQLQEDVFSAVAQCERVVTPIEQLLRDRAYHFHHKMMLKEPLVGGAWEWHQDYGYWYQLKHDGLLFPDTASCMVAVNRASKENGCLQVIRGSHRMGRIEHGVVGTQAGADQTRVEAALKHLELVYCDMEPGTALFFHGNTLHSSSQNRSSNARWAFISCYSTLSNISCNGSEAHIKNRDNLEKWPDSKVKEIGRRQLQGLMSTASV